MDKIKISEEDFCETLCNAGCTHNIKAPSCSGYKHKTCDYYRNIRAFDVFEIIPDKTNLEKANEIKLEKINRYYKEFSFDGYEYDYKSIDTYSIEQVDEKIKLLYQVIEELQNKGYKSIPV
jgi:hypothetical protein